MTFLARLKELVRPAPHHVPLAKPRTEESENMADRMQEAIARQKCAESDALVANASAERSARVSSVVTKTIIRRRLDRPSILQSAEEAMQIIEGRIYVPPR